MVGHLVGFFVFDEPGLQVAAIDVVETHFLAAQADGEEEEKQGKSMHVDGVGLKNEANLNTTFGGMFLGVQRFALVMLRILCQSDHN